MTMKKLVGISCCNKSFGPNGLPNHAASDFCVQAICQISNAIPVLLPAIGTLADATCLLGRLDGILLTGSRTNISPSHYGGLALDDDAPEDPARDATTLPLIRAAIARGTPILAICRGLQEMNVALGGTLHPAIHRVPGRLNHAAAEPEDAVARVAPAHTVALTPGGLLHRLAQAPTISVNSLHRQGIDRLAPGLAVEAVAPDGTIEAVRATGSPNFALGLQWHPEFDALTNPFSARIFKAFGDSLHQVAGLDRLAAD